MKSLVGKFGMLALLAAVGGLAVQGCSSDIVSSSPSHGAGEGDSGQVSLNLVPVAGITVNSVNYVVTGTPAIPGTPLPSGVLPTPGTSNNFTFGIPVPVGTGYTLSLTAVSAETGDDITCTGSHGPFDVTPNTSTGFPMTLTCVDNSNGQLVATVDVKTNACPRLIPDYASAIPGSANVGSNIALNALGHDLDGKVVTYAWSIAAADAAVGSFVNATSQAATFTCNGPGDAKAVTVTLSNGECTKPLITTVTCKSLTCGNGALDAGEDCDFAIPAASPGGSPAGTTFGCPNDCKVACGDGVLEAPTEECELNGGPPTGTCTAQCRTRIPTCGDGFINGTDVCDGLALPPGSPLGTTCKADCSGVNVLSCGDGIVSTGVGEECELPATTLCSDDCQSVGSQGCTDCEAGSACAPFAQACINSLGITAPADATVITQLATPALRTTACFDVQECITDTNCGDGVNTFTSCFCGALTTAQCSAAPDSGAGAPAGACAAKIKAGMGAGATNAQILARFTNRNYPSGAGINRYNCQKNNPVCSPLCGF
jgi:hypothetical protein